MFFTQIAIIITVLNFQIIFQVLFFLKTNNIRNYFHIKNRILFSEFQYTIFSFFFIPHWNDLKVSAYHKWVVEISCDIFIYVYILYTWYYLLLHEKTCAVFTHSRVRPSWKLHGTIGWQHEKLVVAITTHFLLFVMNRNYDCVSHASHSTEWPLRYSGSQYTN